MSRHPPPPSPAPRRATTSLRRRLIVALLLSTCLAALTLLELSRMVRQSAEQRRQFTRSLVLQELERASATPELESEHPTLVGLRSGIVEPGSTLTARDLPTDAQSVLRTLLATSNVDTPRVVEVEVEVTAPVAYYVGVLRRADGSTVWTSYPARIPQHYARFRMLGIAFAGLVLLLAALALFTVGSLDRGVRALTQSLRELDHDLGAPIAEPTVRELGPVAEGIRSLAKNLQIAHDTREQLTAELRRGERLAGLGRVVAGVAHEVRNPLAALKLRVDLAKGNLGGAPASLHEDLEAMGREITRLDRLVTDLLVLGGRKARPRTLESLGALVQERAHLMQPWAESRGVELHVRGDVTLAVDRDGLAQALDNLLRNAVEASPRGQSVEVHVHVDPEQVSIVVRDKGRGVAEERSHELFEPFFTTKAEGLGLGLATARAIAVGEGGELRYRRHDGVTCFELSLPRSNA